MRTSNRTTRPTRSEKTAGLRVDLAHDASSQCAWSSRLRRKTDRKRECGQRNRQNEGPSIVNSLAACSQSAADDKAGHGPRPGQAGLPPATVTMPATHKNLTN